MSRPLMNPMQRLALSNRVFSMLEQEGNGAGRFCGPKAPVLERLRARYKAAQVEVEFALHRAAEASRA